MLRMTSAARYLREQEIKSHWKWYHNEASLMRKGLFHQAAVAILRPHDEQSLRHYRAPDDGCVRALVSAGKRLRERIALPLLISIQSFD